MKLIIEIKEKENKVTRILGDFEIDFDNEDFDLLSCLTNFKDDILTKIYKIITKRIKEDRSSKKENG